MKKLLLSIIALVCAGTCSIFADGYRIGNGTPNGIEDGYIMGSVTLNGIEYDYGWYLENSEFIWFAIVESAEEATGKVTIPSQIQLPDGGSKCTVMLITSGAFHNNKNITSVSLPNTITAIPRIAFSGCSNLTSVSLPNSITSINENAFQDCSSLKNIVIPNSVTSIGNYTFGNCSGLTSVIIPNSVTSIGDGAFYNCSSLTSIQISGAIELKKSTFYGCKALTQFSNSSITSIGQSVFAGCTSLKRFTATKISNISTSAFADCNSLRYIDLSKCPLTGFSGFNNIPTNTLVCLPEGNSTASGTNIVIGNTCQKYVLTEGKPFEVPITSFTAKKIEYKRDIPANSLSTIFLNYAPPAREGVKYYKFDNYADGVVTFIEEKEPKANTAYIITTGSTTVSDFSIDSDTEVKWVNETGAQYYGLGGLLFVGTSQTQDLEALTIWPSFVQAGKTNFMKVESSDAGIVVPPLRAVIKNGQVGTVTTPDLLTIKLKDAEVSGIKEIGDVHSASGNENGAWFTLNGTKLNGKPSQKGLYIRNGKAVVVK